MAAKKTTSKKKAAKTASSTAAATTTVSKTKHKKGQRYAVKFDAARVVALFKGGMTNLTDLAAKMGFPRGVGQNRTAKVLIAAGLYKRGAKRR